MVLQQGSANLCTYQFRFVTSCRVQDLGMLPSSASYSLHLAQAAYVCFWQALVYFTTER